MKKYQHLWMRFFGFAGRKPVVVYNRRGTRYIWITWRLTRYAHYRRTPISPNFNQGVEAARPVSPLNGSYHNESTVAPFCSMQRLITHPWSCDRRNPEARARQRRTPFGCQRNTAYIDVRGKVLLTTRGTTTAVATSE